MEWFSKRNNLRKEIEKTYDIDYSKYNVLFKMCSTFFTYLSWRFPKYCPDDFISIYSYDEQSMIEELEFEIPALVKDKQFVKADTYEDPFDGKLINNFDQFAILDFIEYIYANIKDYSEGRYHSFYGHIHLSFLDTNYIATHFKDNVNRYFDKLGLLYVLKDNGEIERVVSNGQTINELHNLSSDLKDIGLKQLIDQSISFYLKPGEDNVQVALEKIWAAFERIKTIYHDLDKKDSSEKLITTITTNQEGFYQVIKKEFIELTSLGNTFRIRHHETDKIDFVSNDYREYCFNRCLSLMVLVLSKMKELNINE